MPGRCLRPSNEPFAKLAIVVGADGTPESLPVIEFAFRQASLRGMPLHIVHVYKDPRATGWRHRTVPTGQAPPPRPISGFVAGIAEAYPDVHVSIRLEDGAIDESIERGLRPYELVVVGRRPHHSSHRFGEDTVATSVLERSQSTVVVVHEASSPGSETPQPPPRGRRSETTHTRRDIMKAAVVTDFTKPLTIEDRPIPAPGPGQVLVRIESSGLCHTDIHAAHGDWPVKPTPPFVPGHEGVGVIQALGTGVTARAVGDRVALPWLGHACGHCDYCVRGWETLCEQQQNTGYSIDGGFAEYAVADAEYTVPVPDGVSPHDAAPLTCAGVTTYKAIKVADIRPTERVAVFGIGGLGHLAVQYAHIVGGTVIAVDIEESKLDMARELGADHVVNAAETDPVAAIEALGGADVAVVLAVMPSVFESAFASLRRGGRLVCVGLPPSPKDR